MELSVLMAPSLVSQGLLLQEGGDRVSRRQGTPFAGGCLTLRVPGDGSVTSPVTGPHDYCHQDQTDHFFQKDPRSH